MAFRKTVLSNGVTLVTEDMPAVRSITLGFWYRVGSRDERPDQAGLTHFMEHMMFKGTPTRSAIEVSEAFDMLGAESNAFTSKEYTCYYARFVDEKLDEVLALLADMVLHPALRDSDIEPEREVVLEEIARSLDQPDDYVFELFTDCMLPTHPLGRPVLGTQELVGSYLHPQCSDFHNEHYHSGNLVVSAVGNLDHDALAAKLEKLLADIRPGTRNLRPAIVESNRGKFAAQQKDTEQAHLVYGFPWYPAGDEQRFAGSLMTAILGGSMSSRLFQEVREKNGLAYSIFAGASSYGDVGLFYVYCGTRPDNLGKATTIIRRELERMACEPPTSAELARSCEVICSQLLMGMESTSDRMVRLGRRQTMGLEQTPISELVERYRAVTPEHVRAVAERYLTATPTASVVSSFSPEKASLLVFG